MIKHRLEVQNVVNYYFCDVCHYCFEAESLPDRCPDCGKTHKIFGESKLDEVALSYSIPVLARLPIDPETAKLFDAGKMAEVNLEPVAAAATLLSRL